jgi:hypothetical protein
MKGTTIINIFDIWTHPALPTQTKHVHHLPGTMLMIRMLPSLGLL